MSTRRFFSGARDGGTTGSKEIATIIRKMEMQGGRRTPLTATQRFKVILEHKLAEQRKKVAMGATVQFALKGTKASAAQMSKRTEATLKEIARRKAAKDAKAMRQMVVIRPRWYGNLGQITAKGIVYDHAGNITLRVDAKTGKIKTVNGWAVGKYKPGSSWHDSWMQTWIKKHSPYWIQLEKMKIQQELAAMQALQQQGAVTVHGVPIDPALLQQHMQHLADAYGNLVQHDAHGNVINGSHHHGMPELQPGQRTNLGVTAWGVQSNNVWGTFGDNVHGGFSDNVWGTTYNNIWGGVGEPSGWGRPGRNIWRSGIGTGQKNYIAAWGRMAMAFMGFGGRQRTSGRMVSAPSIPTGPRGRR